MAHTQAVGAGGYSQQNNTLGRLGKSKDDRLFEYVYNNPQMADELDDDEEGRFYEWAEKKEQEDEKVAEPPKYNGETSDKVEEPLSKFNQSPGLRLPTLSPSIAT